MISNTNFYLLLFHSLTAFRLQILHLLLMMLRNVVHDYFFKELLHMLKLFTSPTHDGQQHPSTLWVHRRCQTLSSSLVFTLHDDFLTGLHTSDADFLTGLPTQMNYTPIQISNIIFKIRLNFQTELYNQF